MLKFTMKEVESEVGSVIFGFRVIDLLTKSPLRSVVPSILRLEAMEMCFLWRENYSSHRELSGRGGLSYFGEGKAAI